MAGHLRGLRQPTPFRIGAEHEDRLCGSALAERASGAFCESGDRQDSCYEGRIGGSGVAKPAPGNAETLEQVRFPVRGITSDGPQDDMGGPHIGGAVTAASASQEANDALATARALIQQGRNEEAITELKRLAALDPKAKGVNHELGVAYYHQNEYLNAAQYLVLALQENPNDHDTAQLLGLSYYAVGRPADAIPALEKVHAWYPNANMDAIYVLGICYALTKRYPEARRALARLYRVPEDSAAAHLMLASVLA